MNIHARDICKSGYSVVPKAYDQSAIVQMRQTILDNTCYMSNTRPTKTSYHIAGFQRFPSLEYMHNTISANGPVRAALDDVYDENQMLTLGLSDITINRSQPWHTDLLRGDYAEYLSTKICWGTKIKPCIKLLVYLQDGAALLVVPGSHLRTTNLSDDRNVIPPEETEVHKVKVSSGDAVLMDIRLVHRGATETEMEEKKLGDDAKILISTVFGDRYSELAQSMHIGNAHRLIDWDNRNQKNIQG